MESSSKSMIDVTVAELQSDLIGFLTRAKAGELFVVWDGDKVLAHLTRPKIVFGALSHLAIDIDEFDSTNDEVTALFEASEIFPPEGK